MKASHISSLLGFAPGIALLGTAQADELWPQLPHRLVHQFPFLTYLQSIYVRANGDVLATTVWPGAAIHYVSGAASETPVASLAHQFEELNATTSIVETEPNVFVLLGGQQSSIGMGINGTFGVWELDLRPTLGPNPGKAAVREIVRFTKGGLSSGLDVLPGFPHIVLVADSTLGGVFRVDLQARTYEYVIDDVHMKPLHWAATYYGISNLHIHKGHIYFINSYEATVYRLAITDDGYPAQKGATSEYVKKVRSIYLDNFNFGPRGGDTIWAASNANNQLVAITPDGTDTVVLGVPNEMALAGPVATMFGRLENDTNTLYVATGGGMLNPINGTNIEGGKIVAVDTRPFFDSKYDRLELRKPQEDV